MSLIKSEHNLGGFDLLQNNESAAGRSDYCYLFPNDDSDSAPGIFTSSNKVPEETLGRLLYFAKWMERVNSGNPVDDLTLRIRLPAAFTYFGQFLNHDLSAPVGSMVGIVDDIPEKIIIGEEQLPGIAKLWRVTSTNEVTRRIRNEHAKPLSLDSLYGEASFAVGGRPTSDEARALFQPDGLHFVLGKTCNTRETTDPLAKNPVEYKTDAPDLPRHRLAGGKLVSLIADRRNDGNLILGQMHLALMLFHNKAVDALRDENLDPADCFAAARRLVTRHYHWCILHDFLPRILSKGALQKAIDGPRLGRPADAGKVPMEFTTAAYRFGHSMISSSYDFNSNFGTAGSLQPQATLGDLFSFTSAGGMKNHGQLPDHWVIDWDRITADQSFTDSSRSEQIDLRFAQDLMGAVPDAPRLELQSIVARNLVRGFHRRIPFGQELAKACQEPVLKEEQIREVMPNKLAEDPRYGDSKGDQARRTELEKETPAWLYFLCEAKFFEKGERLGPTASRIIAETFVNLMQLKNGAIEGDLARAWKPEQSKMKTADGQPIATLRDLLLFAVSP